MRPRAKHIVPAALVMLTIYVLQIGNAYCQVDTTWVRKYAGPGSRGDIAFAMAVDAYDNVYVTGLVQTTPGGNYTYGTVKYNTGGHELWRRLYVGPDSGSGTARAAVVDKEGNLIITGEMSGGVTSFGDFATVKYTPDGDTLWARHYDGPAHIEDRAWALAVDSSGNVYVVGGSSAVSPYGDPVLLKYTPDGLLHWERRPIPRGSLQAVSVDAFGDIVVTGSYFNGLSGDCLTAKYDSSGNLVWLRTFDGPAHAGANANALALDASGNVYVTGNSQDIVTGYDYLTIKYGPQGDTIWIAEHDGTGHWDDIALAVDVNDDGVCCITGRGISAIGGWNILTVCYEPSGALYWVREVDGPYSGYDQGNAIVVQPNGSVIVTGMATVSYTGSEYVTLRYGPTGDTLWLKRYPGTATGSYETDPTCLAVDRQGSVLVSGRANDGSAGSEYVTIKYEPCSCPCAADPHCDEIRSDLLDVQKTINVALRGVPPDQGPDCRISTHDVNCDAIIDIMDVIDLIDVAFNGLEPSATLCLWCDTN